MGSGFATDLEMVNEYLDRWNEHDIDAIVSMMTEDCVFETSAGPDVMGRRFVGRDEVRGCLAWLLRYVPGFSFSDVSVSLFGDRAIAEWTMHYSSPDGARTSTRGCDLFTIRDGKIARKDSYRKQRFPLD